MIATAPISASPAKTQCLSRAVKDGADQGKVTLIEIPDDQSAEFQARGFQPVACDTSQLLSASIQEDLCSYAGAKDPALNARYWMTYGITPRESCRLAKRVTIGR